MFSCLCILPCNFSIAMIILLFLANLMLIILKPQLSQLIYHVFYIKFVKKSINVMVEVEVMQNHSAENNKSSSHLNQQYQMKTSIHNRITYTKSECFHIYEKFIRNNHTNDNHINSLYTDSCFKK
jgi:hypothetical protein